MQEQEKTYLDFVDNELLGQLVKMHPQYTPQQHLEMLSNIPPHLLDRQAFLDGIVEETRGQLKGKQKELAIQKKLKDFYNGRKTKPLTEQQKQYNQAYLHHLKNPQTTTQKKEGGILMEVKEAKREVWEMYKKVLGKDKKVKVLKSIPTKLQLKDIKDAGMDYVVIDHHVKILMDILTLYFIRSPHSPLNLKKGLFIFGGCGVGKTAIFKTFLKFAEKHQLSTKFTSLKVATLIREVLDDKKQDRITHATYSQKLIDDLGEEAGLCSWYDGVNKGVNLLKRILDTRYEKFIASGLITHISTNLNPIINELGSSEVRKLYGDRLGSRFNEMFNVICLEGGDKRK